MDLATLQADALMSFGVFARHRNFTHAAAELHISQPSLHVKIAKLSRALGVELYERDGRRLILTHAGRRLAEFVADQARVAGDLLAELDSSSAVAPVGIAAGRGAYLWVISEAIGKLVDAGAQLRLAVDDRDGVIELLASGGTDIGVVAHDPPPTRLESVVLADFPQVALVPASHRLARRPSVDLADLAGERLVLPPVGRPHRANLERALDAAGSNNEVVAEVDGWDLMAKFVRIGVGVAVVNGCVTPPSGVRAIPVSDLPTVRYWVCWRPARAARARAFLDAFDGES